MPWFARGQCLTVGRTEPDHLLRREPVAVSKVVLQGLHIPLPPCFLCLQQQLQRREQIVVGQQILDDLPYGTDLSHNGSI